MNRISLNIFTFVLFLSGIYFAQEFKSSVDRTTVGQNERFQVYFVFSGSNTNNLRNFSPPNFQGFKILSGPNQSTSMQIINGQMSSSVTYSYFLAAAEPGEYTINSASINLGSTVYKTDPIKIKVVQGAAQQQSVGSEVSSEEIAKNLFIVAQVDKSSAYKGEQITVTYKLYTRLEISSPQISKLPVYEGFWAEEIETDNTIRFDIEMYKGERFRSAVIKRAALFPTKAGNLSITPFELNIPVILQKRRNANPFDDSFFDSFFSRRETVDFLAKSNQITINVKELPLNAPSTFNGAVGDFKMSVSVDKTELESNEPLSIKINLSGTGNIKLLEIPKLNLPSGFEEYEPKIIESISRSGKISGSKNAEYLIIPRLTGEKEISPIEFTFFSPSQKKYVTLKSPAYNLKIKRSSNAVEPGVTGFSKESVRLLSDDIRFIKTSKLDLREKEDFSAVRSWFWLALIFPLFAFIGAVSYIKRRESLHGNIDLMRNKKAEKKAKAKLKTAKKELDLMQFEKFYNELYLALFGYLEDKLGLKREEFTQERVLQLLLESNVTESLVGDIKDILDKCEFARFAPQSEGGKNAADIYSTTVEKIVQLENSIKNRKN